MGAAILFSCGHVRLSSLRHSQVSLAYLNFHRMRENVDTVIINCSFSAKFQKQTLYVYDNTVD